MDTIIMRFTAKAELCACPLQGRWKYSPVSNKSGGNVGRDKTLLQIQNKCFHVRPPISHSIPKEISIIPKATRIRLLHTLTMDGKVPCTISPLTSIMNLKTRERQNRCDERKKLIVIKFLRKKNSVRRALQ